MISTRAVRLCVLGAALLAPVVAQGAVFELSEFQGSFDGWSQQWNNYRPAPHITPGVVSLSDERGYRDGHSLKFDMGNGRGDDGTLWIEKAYDVPAGVTTPVGVSFALFNTRRSDANLFQVKAYIGERDPQVQTDFDWIGLTNLTNGWDNRFTHVKHVTAPSGRAWVALGISVAWESHRDYWIDHVRVSTAVIPGDANLDSRVDGSDFAILATYFGRGPGANWAHGNFNGDLRVDGADFSILASNFGRAASGGQVTEADWAALHGFQAAAASSVPEPVHGAWLLAILAGCHARRRRVG